MTLSYEMLLKIHSIVLENSGGREGVLDENILKSALGNIDQIVFGEELYPSAVEKASRLCYSLASTQGFVDGNKRTAISVLRSILFQSNILLICSDEDLINLGLDIANNKIGYPEVYLRVRSWTNYT